MSAEYLMLFPADYPVFYVGFTEDWWPTDDFASTFTSDFTKFMTQDNTDGLAFVFASDELGGENGYAIMSLSVGYDDNNAYIRGVRHIATFPHPPDRKDKNEAYIYMMSDPTLNKYPYGSRYYVGSTNSMKKIKEIIEAWMLGEINETGSVPEFDYVEAF